MAERSSIGDVLTAFGIITALYAVSQAMDRKKSVVQAAQQFALTQKRLDSIEEGIRALYERVS